MLAHKIIANLPVASYTYYLFSFSMVQENRVFICFPAMFLFTSLRLPVWCFLLVLARALLLVADRSLKAQCAQESTKDCLKTIQDEFKTTIYQMTEITGAFKNSIATRISF